MLRCDLTPTLMPLLCCPQAIDAWRENTDYGHCQLVKSYFQCVSGFTSAEVLKQAKRTAGKQEPPQGFFAFVKQFLASSARDPFFAVISYRDFQPGAE